MAPRKRTSNPVQISEQAAVAELEAGAAALVPMTPQEIAQGVIESVAASTEMPETKRTVEPVNDRPKPRSTLAFHFGDGESVQMIDDGNRGGLGVLFALKEKPSQHVLEAVKADVTYGQTVKRGMSWKGGQWRKQVSDNPVGDRLEVEGRVKEAAERILAERAKGGSERTPF